MPKGRRIARSKEIIASVSASIKNEPNQSIPRRSQELGIAQTTLWRIMRKDLGLLAFKIKLTQELKTLDHFKRLNFSNWALAKLEENEEFYRKIIFSDEVHFWLNGFVTKQNMCYWSATNPNVLLETPLHPQKVTVRCGFHAGGVIGPYFVVDENDELKLKFKRNVNAHVLDCCVDADWAGDTVDRKSTTGYVIRMYGNSISWK